MALSHWTIMQFILDKALFWTCMTSGADSIGHGGTCPHFHKWLGTGAPRVEDSKQETDQTVLNTMKALTNTTKTILVLLQPKCGGERPKYFFRRFAPHGCPHFRAGPVHPTCKFVQGHWTSPKQQKETIDKVDLWSMAKFKCSPKTAHPESLKVGRLHKGKKNNVISGFIWSPVLNTSTLAPRDGWSGAQESALCWWLEFFA